MLNCDCENVNPGQPATLLVIDLMNSKKIPAKTEIVTAGILVIGDEILSGRTKDVNINYIAKHLTEIGIRLIEARVIGDEEDQIIGALNEMRANYDYLFTTGGIGPTHDDITAPSVAKAFGLALIVDKRAIELMRERFADHQISDTRLRMARVPEGAQLIENSISFAPGFKIENVIVMAGVPAIMQVMLDAVTPMLRVGKKMYSVTIILDRPESIIAQDLKELQDQYLSVSMGSYPFFKSGRLGTQIVLRSTSKTDLNLARNALNDRLITRGLMTKQS